MLPNRERDRVRRFASSPEPVSSTELVKQLHDTGRLSFELYVRWFTFFVTVNFVALGWLAKHKPDERADSLFALLITVAMMVFIALGALSAGTVKVQLTKLRNEVVARVKPISEAERYVAASMPSDVYIKNLRLMTIALYFLLAVWGVMGVILWTAF